MKKIALIALLALVLTGCSHQKPISTPSPSSVPVVQSSGDVDKELDAIDKELLEAEKEDIPTVDEKGLGL